MYCAKWTDCFVDFLPGYDMGIISGAKPQLQGELGLSCYQLEAAVSMLPLGAFVASRGVEQGTLSPTWDVTLTTAHQWFGAVLLALAVALMCWNFKLLAPEEPSAGL